MSLSLSIEEQKREVLAKIKFMIQDTDDKEIQKVLSFLESKVYRKESRRE